MIEKSDFIAEKLAIRVFLGTNQCHVIPIGMPSRE